MNKSALKELSAEAEQQSKPSNDYEADSEGCDSSEEEGECLKSCTSPNAKKAIEVI